jgi:hypothetical protein
MRGHHTTASARISHSGTVPLLGCVGGLKLACVQRVGAARCTLHRPGHAVSFKLGHMAIMGSLADCVVVLPPVIPHATSCLNILPPTPTLPQMFRVVFNTGFSWVARQQRGGKP